MLDDVLTLMSATGDEPVEDLRSRCQKLLLQHHPDRVGRHTDLYIEIHAVWKALTSQESWQAHLAAAHSSLQQEVSKPVWKDVLLSDMTTIGEDVVYACRCGGDFQVAEEEVQDLIRSGEADDLLLDCCTCSLQINVTLTRDKCS